MAYFLRGTGLVGTFPTWSVSGDFTISGKLAFNSSNEKGLILCNSASNLPFIGNNNNGFYVNLNTSPAIFIDVRPVTKDEIIEFQVTRVGLNVTLTINDQTFTATESGPSPASFTMNSMGNSSNSSFNTLDADIYELNLLNGTDNRSYLAEDFPSTGTTLVESGGSGNDITFTGSISWVQYTLDGEPTVGSITLKQLGYNNFVFQRNSAGVSPVSRTVTFEGSPSFLEYALLDGSTDEVINNWSVFDADPQNGESTLRIELAPTSETATYKIAVRFGDDVSVVDTDTKTFTLGDKLLSFGQSLAYHMRTVGSVPALNGYMQFNGSYPSATSSGRGDYETAKVIIDSDGVAVQILNVAVGSSPLMYDGDSENWLNENSNLWQDLVSGMDAFIGDDNRIAGAYWQQGHTDYVYGRTESEYLTALNTLMSRLRTAYKGADGDELPLYVATQGRNVPEAGTPTGKQGIRNALLSFIAQNNKVTHVPVYASELTDTVHSTESAYAIVGREIGLKHLDNRGSISLKAPAVNRVEINDERNELTLTYDSLLDTAITPYSTEGVRVDFGGTSYAIESYQNIDDSTTKITLSTALPEGGAINIYQGYGNGSTTSQLVYPTSKGILVGGESASLTSETFYLVFSEGDTENSITHKSQSPIVYDAPQNNQPPTANAGQDQSVAAGATCILEGSASSDSDGTIVSYSWRKVSGPTIALANANQAVASFIAPSESTIQTLVFELTVTDDDGVTSTDTVTVTVAAVPDVADPLDPTLSVISIKSKVGIEDDVQSFGVVSLYQYTDNFILCEVVSKSNAALSPDSFSQAEYRIVDNKGTNVVKLGLGTGIKEADGKFLIHINSGILNSSHKGSLKHQFVVWNQAGYKLPPIFGGTVNIIPVLEPTL